MASSGAALQSVALFPISNLKFLILKVVAGYVSVPAVLQ
jgi:hypothetical protein